MELQKQKRRNNKSPVTVTSNEDTYMHTQSLSPSHTRTQRRSYRLSRVRNILKIPRTYKVHQRKRKSELSGKPAESDGETLRLLICLKVFFERKFSMKNFCLKLLIRRYISMKHLCLKLFTGNFFSMKHFCLKIFLERKFSVKRYFTRHKSPHEEKNHEQMTSSPIQFSMHSKVFIH